jgi:hypothetical protein
MPLNCTNTIEVQVNLDGRIHPNLLHARTAGNSR